MAQSRKEVLDRISLENWRKALPGVPDDQIFIPRYHAKDFFFPPPNDSGEERETLVPWFIEQTIGVYVPPAERSRFADSVRGVSGRAWRRAARWWDSLEAITPLKLNQSVFTRREKWKDVFHYTELMFCLALCHAWLDLPKRQRTATAARKIVGDLYRQKLRCWIKGEIAPGIRDTTWDAMEARQTPPANIISIDLTGAVEEMAAKLPREKREAFYRKVSEEVNRARIQPKIPRRQSDKG